MQDVVNGFCETIAKTIQNLSAITVRDISYRFITKVPLFQSGKIVYYACRDPSDNCVLVAFSQTAPIISDELYTAWDDLRKALCLPRCTLLDEQRCRGRFECFAYNYLPNIIGSAQLSELCSIAVLGYDCINIAKMVWMQKLLEEYYIDTILAHRLMINLIHLVDWLTRLQVEIDISAKNLLVNLDTAAIALIDWHEAKVVETLGQDMICQYYRSIAQLVLDLTGATCQGNFRWQCPIEPRGSHLYCLFKLLTQIVTFDFNLPEAVDDAVDYMINLREQHEYLVPRIMEFLLESDLKPGQPRYELKSREDGGEKNG